MKQRNTGITTKKINYFYIRICCCYCFFFCFGEGCRMLLENGEMGGSVSVETRLVAVAQFQTIFVSFSRISDIESLTHLYK